MSCENDIAPCPSSTNWERKVISNTFGEASRRTIKELDTIEIFELGNISEADDLPQKMFFFELLWLTDGVLNDLRSPASSS